MCPACFGNCLYERPIRAAAGLGRAPASPDPDRYIHRYAHCEVLVIGAGPAGLAAASAASANGDRVILCDEQAEPGGSLLSRPAVRIDRVPAADLITEALDACVPTPDRTPAVGRYNDDMVAFAGPLT